MYLCVVDDNAFESDENELEISVTSRAHIYCIVTVVHSVNRVATSKYMFVTLVSMIPMATATINRVLHYMVLILGSVPIFPKTLLLD